MREQFLQLLLQAFDTRIDEEKGLRDEEEYDSAHWHHAFGRVDGVDTGRHLVEQVFENHGHLLDDAHKRNTALTVELNELCQQYGIGRIGDSLVPAIKTYIKNIQNTLDLTERMIISEIGDFAAGLGHPGEPTTPEQIQAQLMARVQRVFADVRLQADGK